MFPSLLLTFATFLAPSQSPAKIEIEDGFALEIAGLTGIEAVKDAPRRWNAQFEGRPVAIQAWSFDLSKTFQLEPEDAVEAARDDLLATNKTLELAFEALATVPTTAGAAPLLARTHSSYAQDEEHGHVFLLGGVLDIVAWAVAVRTSEELDDGSRARVETALAASPRWSGKVRDPRWSDAEAKAYFDRRAPSEARKKYQKPIRTDHFIVLSSHPSANQFAKKLEAWYDDVEKVLPLVDAPERRLIPVLIFRQSLEFDEFKAALPPPDSKAEKGYGVLCDGPWYATYFDYNYDATHLYKLTQLCLSHRLRAFGGCQWYRTGLRSLVSSRANERGDAARAVRKKEHTPIEKLLDDAAWEARGQGAATDLKGVSYADEACMWMEFLRESKSTKAKFVPFIRSMSGVRDEDSAGVTKALEKAFGGNLADLEKRYIEYCVARK